MLEYEEPKNERSKIFNNSEEAIKYCVDTGLIKTEELCCTEAPSCSIVKSKKHLNGYCYQCKVCLKRRPILLDTLISKPKIKLSDYLLAIYKHLQLEFEQDVLRNLEISKKSYQTIKKQIGLCFRNHFNTLSSTKLGGLGVKVQVDETVISHGPIPNCPSNLNDDHRGLIWLLGIIEEQSKSIKLILLPNRSVETFSSIFKEHLLEGTTVLTDGHRSYPGAVQAINGQHIVVNHSLGFKNSNGFHTNNVENLWSIMKYEVKRRRGILHSNITSFLEEFSFRYTFLRRRTSETMIAGFRIIIEFLFNK